MAFKKAQTHYPAKFNVQGQIGEWGWVITLSGYETKLGTSNKMLIGSVKLQVSPKIMFKEHLI